MSFADFPQQRQVVELLQRSLERRRLAHAYLFTGDRLDELEAVAHTLAQTLNCHSPRTGADGAAVDCCGHCLPCKKIADDVHADVQWVRPESKMRQIGVDQIRELIRTVNLKPTEAEFKVGVIVAADRLNAAAANAFLKTLEEPPARSILILLSTEPQQLLETILSRCLRLTFAGEGGAALDAASLEWVKQFSETAAGEQAGLLARYKLLGTLLTRLSEVRAEVEKIQNARSPLERYDDVEPELRERWEEELKASIEAEYRRRRAELLRALQWWLRDVWLHRLGLAADLTSFPDFGAAARAVAQRIAAADATDNLRIIEQLQRLLATNVQEALALEVGLLKLKL
ncbi:MAG: hypothetical protein HY300_04080 [Verrucomicrobia bacterium]|nr:hypothetical protein [Verrucomicrobiota bacterium]